MLTEHKGICLKINGKRTVRLKKVLLSLRIVLSKHMVHLKFMLILSLFFKTVKSNEKASGSYTEKKNEDHIPCSFSYKLVCFDNKFSKPSCSL